MIEEELNRQHKRTLMEDDDCDLLVSDNEDDINICNNNNINNLRETDNPIKKIGIFSDENTVNYF